MQIFTQMMILQINVKKEEYAYTDFASDDFVDEYCSDDD